MRLWVLALVVALQVAVPGAQGTAIKLVDVAAQAGVDLLNVSGGPAKDYIVDANGNGAAFLDYDNDGDLDVADRQRIHRAALRRGRRSDGCALPEHGEGSLQGRHRRQRLRSPWVGFRRMRRGLRQRRLRGRVHHRVRPRRAMAQHRQGDIRGRHTARRRRRIPMGHELRVRRLRS